MQVENKHWWVKRVLKLIMKLPMLWELYSHNSQATHFAFASWKGKQLPCTVKSGTGKHVKSYRNIHIQKFKRLLVKMDPGEHVINSLKFWVVWTSKIYALVLLHLLFYYFWLTVSLYPLPFRDCMLVNTKVTVC